MGQSPVLLLPCLTTPFLLIFFLQLHFFVYSSTPFSFSSVHDNHLCPDKDKQALFQFKQTLSISIHSYASEYCDEYGNTPYPKTNQWNMSSDCCKWDGVTCNRLTGDIIGLDLSCSQLVGVLHSNCSLFFQLPHLQRLNLAFNDFSGSMIPREFDRFVTGLTHLNLSYSNIAGPVPLEISYLSKLVSLDLSYNYDLILNDRKTEFQHQFLLQNLSSFLSLTFLDLSGTGLRRKLPHEIFFLPNLKTLNLAYNPNVTGVLLQSNLIASNGSSITSLRELDLSEMLLSEEVADIVGSLKSLKSLKLINCNLTGVVIPKFIFNLTHLTELDLSQNNLESQIPIENLLHLRSLSLSSNKWTGPFPSWVANLSQLVYLDLSDNSLMGPLPSNIIGLQKLTHLSLSQNSLNGTIPSWVFDLPLLEVLFLDSNQLQGQLSEFQFKSNSLKAIVLSNNELSGFVPQSIFQQLDLRALYVDWNKLSGIVEIEMFSSLAKLEVLSLSYNNNLSVRLSTINNTFINATFPNLKSLELSSLKIKEFPYFLRAMENLEFLDLSNNQIHGRVPEWAPSKWRNSLKSLYLGSNFLEEPIFLWICNSTSLRFLRLSGNDFSGVLPHCLGNLSDSLIGLDLSMNHFHGTIPSTFSNLNNLKYLYLGSNFLKESTPLRICNYISLVSLDLSSNNFGGVLPHCLGNLRDRLLSLDLSNNEFRGVIPNVFETFQFLEDLDLHNNNFCGTIPSRFAKGLRSLNLHGNHLQGAVPSWLANCVELEVLDLGKNQIKDSFPNWLETLPELHVLVLSFNRFHGPINTNSKNKNPFPKLRIINLSCNEFSGLLPELFFKNFRAMVYVDENKEETKYVGRTGYYQSSVVLVMKRVTMEIKRILTTLITIDLSSNKFKGEIPDVIGNLKFLRQLNLSHNSLIGRIPSLLGDLSELESLDLNSNQLVGEIPHELANLNFLAKLNLSHNHFRGHIPSGGQLNTFLSDSYYGNLALCGFPLSNCEKGEMQQLSLLQEENYSDSMGGFTWEAVLIGYGCGIVLGFVTGYIMFLVGKPKWFTEIVKRELRRQERRPQRRGYKHCGRRN